MGWNEHAGRVTAAFEMWTMAEHEQTVYLRRTAQLIDAANDTLWRGIRKEPVGVDPEGYFAPLEPIDVFYDSVGGLMPDTHHWLLCASVVKDAVTTLEVYLEAAIDEVRLRTTSPGRWQQPGGPNWRDLRAAWKAELDVELEDEELLHTRALRHVLTHRRGEPVHEKDRRRFGVAEFERVTLDSEVVIGAMTALGRTVRRIDPAAHAAAWAPDEGAGTFFD